MYKYIVFDCDGTILSTEESGIYSLQEILKTFKNIDKTYEELEFGLGIAGRDCLRMLGFSEEEIEPAFQRWTEITNERYYVTDHLYDGIVETIKILKDHHYKIGMVTNRDWQELQGKPQVNEILPLFDQVIVSTDTVNHKPHPEPLLKFMEKTHTKPEELLYIGDTSYDQNCAKGAGVFFGEAAWGSHEKLTPNVKFAHPADIVRFLQEEKSTSILTGLEILRRVAMVGIGVGLLLWGSRRNKKL